MTSDVPVSGTLVWYYVICPREVWLMAHQLNPDEDDANLEYGRFLQSRSYRRERKEVGLGDNRMDFIDMADGKMVVVEVKKSSRAIESARLQLAHYLLSLEEAGTQAEGELRFPEERKKEKVVLDDELRERVREIRREIRRLIARDVPPPAKRVKWCGRCAYRMLCWS